MSLSYYVSPEQMIHDKAEFARKGIAKGKSIVALDYKGGILLAAENPSTSLNKISEIYDRIAFAGVGKYSEFENLRKAGIRYVDIKGYAYSRADVTLKSLANAYSEAIGNVFTQNPKPLEVEILIVEVGQTEEIKNGIYRITFDGSLSDYKDYAAIGGQAERVEAYLKEHFKPDLALGNALNLGRTALGNVENKLVSGRNLEVAVLDRNLVGRKFRRIPAQEIDQLLGL